jgi:hypothetical protein
MRIGDSQFDGRTRQRRMSQEINSVVFDGKATVQERIMIKFMEDEE